VSPWIIIGPVLAIALTAIFVVGWKVLRSLYPPWKPLPGYYPGAMYMAPKDVPPALIVKRLQRAETELINNTRFTAANLALVGHLIRVSVRESESWSDLSRRLVAGQAGTDPERGGYVVDVGRSMLALAHEMAHMCELVIDGQVQYDHAGWEAAGIRKAEEAYEAWLKVVKLP
jgi:hypothetical protein